MLEMTLIGTMKYLSPEMRLAVSKAKQKQVYDSSWNPYKSDMYSFGLVLLQMILLDWMDYSNADELLRKDRHAFVEGKMV